jgi:hypothetical protein
MCFINSLNVKTCSSLITTVVLNYKLSVTSMVEKLLFSIGDKLKESHFICCLSKMERNSKFQLNLSKNKNLCYTWDSLESMDPHVKQICN